MKPIAITYEIAHAAAWDAGLQSMRAAGRTIWAPEDLDAAAEELNRLWSTIINPQPEGR